MHHEEMVEDSGIVTAVNGKQVTVEIERGGGCKSCSMRGFCISKNTPSEFELTSELLLKTGDRVQLEISPGGRALASLLVFGVPLAFLFAGFLIASLWLNELISIFFGFGAMAIGFLLVRLIDRKCSNRLNIRIARKL
jgi:sigma-E factor negative regulatory protein RseC